jgi:hypothetical protein
MFYHFIKSCSDENISSSAGGYKFKLYRERNLKNRFKKQYYISVWVIGFSEYECYHYQTIELSAGSKNKALIEFKEYLKEFYGDNYGKIIKCD